MKEFIGNSLLNKVKLKSKHYDIWDTKLTGFILRVHPSGTMAYRVEFGRGKRVTIGKATYMTPMQARDKAKEILSQAALGFAPNSKKHNGAITLYDFIKKEYEPWRLANRKNGKHDIRRLHVNFAILLGKDLLANISAIAIEKLRTSRINSGIKPATINRDINILKSALVKAVEWGFISENPLKDLKLTKTDNAAHIRFLSKNEQVSLIYSLKQRDIEIKESRQRANLWRSKRNYEILPDLQSYSFGDHLTPMILLSLNTGLRRGELFNITWENINFEKAVLTVSGSISKSGKTRHIPLNTLALQTLTAWRMQNSNAGFVFRNLKTNACFDNVSKAWLNILKTANIEKFRWHDMRHHFASKLVMSGVDLNTVRELLGHADIKMTLRYAHLAPEHKANAVERLVDL